MHAAGVDQRRSGDVNVNPFQRINELLRPHRPRMLGALALAALACLLNLPTPLLVQALVDHVVAGAPAAHLAAFVIALFAVFALQAGINIANTFVIGRIGLQIVRELRHRLYARLQRVGLSYYDQTPTGTIISRLMDDVTAVQNLITGQTLTILTDLGTTVVVSMLLLSRSPRLFVVVLATAPVYAVIFRFFTRRIRSGTLAVRDRLDTMFGHLKEKFDGILVVKAHAREEAEMAEFAAEINAVHRPRLHVERLSAAFSTLSVATSGIGTSLVFAVGAFEALHGRMTPGEVVSAAALAALLFGPVARLADLGSVFQLAAASIERLGEILDQQPDVVEPEQPLALKRAGGLVEFDRVGFSYRKGQPVVWDIRLRVEPGMKIALVGPTGCGKSTLMNLLLRFYDPAWGEIRLDGRPIRQLTLADLRRQVGIVPQDAVIFRQSLAENIRYGAPDADDRRVHAAARAALVHAFAMHLPDGYDTIVGEGGHKLSQGERQRVAIARALCKDPALILLDEATSSLDTVGELLIRKALANLLRNRTAFIIAHRLATVIDADQIVVMDGGLIVQMGTHAELMQDADGPYRQLCLRQFHRLVTPEQRALIRSA